MFSLIIKLCLFPFYCVYYTFYGLYKIITFFFNIPLETDLEKIDTMKGIEFEKFVANLLKHENFYNIETTRASGDYGADIIAEKNKIKYAIQCKRYSSKVSASPIGEILRGMKKYNCDKGIVITNNYFTNQAIEESKICDVELWDRDTIKSIIKKNKNKSNFDTKLKNNSNKNIEKYKDEKKSDIKPFSLEKLDYNNYKEMAIKIQKIYYNLGFNVRVIDVNTSNKFKTEYKCIHEIDDYGKISSKEIGEQVLNQILIENSTIREVDKKYFIISIPLQMINR